MKNLCLDIGNVLIKVNFDELINSFSHLNLTKEEGREFIYDIQKYQDLGITTFDKEIEKKYKESLSAGFYKKPSNDNLKQISALFLKLWNESTLFPNVNVISRFYELSEKYGIKIALLSNIGLNHAEIIGNKLGAKFYDSCVKHFSCFVGARKSTDLYYQSFLMRRPEFQGAVYVDDLSENLIAGESFGFSTYQMDLSQNPDIDKCFKDIENMIIE